MRSRCSGALDDGCDKIVAIYQSKRIYKETGRYAFLIQQNVP